MRRRRQPYVSRKDWVTPVDPREARARAERFAWYDGLPPKIISALVACPFYIEVRLPPAGVNWDLVAERIRAVKTFEQAAECTRMFCLGYRVYHVIR